MEHSSFSHERTSVIGSIFLTVVVFGNALTVGKRIPTQAASIFATSPKSIELFRIAETLQAAEKRAVVPQTVASASTLSISGEEGFPSRGFSPMWAVGFWRCSVREDYQSRRSAQCALAPSHPFHDMPSRITRNSHRPRASDRTMVALKHHLACRSLKLDGRVTIGRDPHEDGQQTKLLQGNETTVGWIARQKPRPPVEAELFS